MKGTRPHETWRLSLELRHSWRTLLGGTFALRFKDRLHLILGFSAGAVIGVAFFDLIPEAIELAGKHLRVSQVTSLVAVGFVLFMILDRMVILHSSQHYGHPRT